MEIDDKETKSEADDESSQKSLDDSNIKPTFCVAMQKDGNTIKLEGTAEDFLKQIEDSEFVWVNVQVKNFKEEGSRIASVLGFNPSMVKELALQRFSGYDDRITELGLLLPVARVKELKVNVFKLIILIRGNLIVTIHGENVTRLVKFARYAETFFKKIPKNQIAIDKISSVLVRILDENNEKNFDGIRAIQEQGEEISKYLIDPTSPRQDLGRDIYKMKHALISYIEALWATLDVIHYLRYGDADAITDNTKILQRIGMLGGDLTRQISISEQMSSVLASGLEVLQSIYNNQLTVLNNRLATIAVWVAILGTAFIVPNTLATIFGTPIGQQVDWHAQMWILVISTVASMIFAYWFVKQREFLPDN
jgi:magnesium transporter